MSDFDNPADVNAIFGQVARDFLDRVSCGEQPDVEEIASTHPQIAEHVRRIFPAILNLGDTSAVGVSLDADAPPKHPKQLGDFRLLHEIGRGGMGVVYEAEQLTMGRTVALKVLPFVALVDDRPLQRFRNEVRAAATLQHPNIIPVYSVGEERGVHYYAMQLIRGQTLAMIAGQLRQLAERSTGLDGLSLQDALSPFEYSGALVNDDPTVEFEVTFDGKRLQESKSGGAPTRSWTAHDRQKYFRSIVKLGIQAARALQHAHEQGIVHRDIKPGNLMLDADGHLWIADFGLARIEADPGITITGDVVGTLRYMSPEQALGKSIVVDNRADIYSLAATLYELLVLRPVFDGGDRRELLEQIAFQDPVRLRRIDSRIPLELDTIVLKGLARDPDQRYSTAIALADDLQRFLDNQPITARRPTLVQRFNKWAYRNKSLVAASSIGLLAVMLTAIVGAIVGIRQASEADAARALAEQRLAIVEHSQQVAERERRATEAAMRTASRHLYLSDMKSASDAYHLDDVPRVANLLDRHWPTSEENDQRGFAWHYLQQLVAPKPVWKFNLGSPIRDSCVSGDGQLIAVATVDQRVQVHQAATGRMLAMVRVPTEVLGLAWDAVNNCIAGGGVDGQIYFWHAPAATVNSVKVQQESQASRAGNQLYAGGSEHVLAPVERLNLAAKTSLLSVVGQRNNGPGTEMTPAREPVAAHSEAIKGVCYADGGATVISCSSDGLIRSWDVATGQQKTEFRGHGREVEAIALRPDSDMLVSVSSDEQIGIWDVTTGQNIEMSRVSAPLTGRMVCVDISRDGVRLVAGDIRGNLVVMDLSDRTCSNHVLIDGIESVAFVGNSSRLAAGTRGGSIHLFSLTAVQQRMQWRRVNLPRWLAHKGRIESLIAVGSGGDVVSGSRDGGLARWSNIYRSTMSIAGSAKDFDVTHDGNMVTCGQDLFQIMLATHERRTCEIASKNDWQLIEAADDCPSVVVADHETIVLFDVLNRLESSRWKFDRDADELAISPDGRLVAVAGWDQRTQVDLFQKGQGTVLQQIPARQCSCLQFSPDGKLLAIGEMDDLLLYNLAESRAVHRLVGHDSTLTDASFDPLGRWVATVSDDRRMKLWGVESGRLIHSIQASAHLLDSVDFSPNGRLVATAGVEPTIRLWHAKSAQQVLKIDVEQPVRKVRFSTSGRHLIARRNDDSIVIYSVPVAGRGITEEGVRVR